MKILTLNFLTCALKTCKSSALSFPLHLKDVELEQAEIELSPQILLYILPRIDWPALIITSSELGFPTLPPQPPTVEELENDIDMMKDLHMLLMETNVMEGGLLCGNCGHIYEIREGTANFLLPNHLI